MKVLYIASNPEEADTLALEREIAALQRRLLAQRLQNFVDFTFLPDISLDELPSCIADIQPDILHISAHSDGHSLRLSDDSRRGVSLSTERLGLFLSAIPLAPKIVYVNACQSAEMAKALVSSKPSPSNVSSSVAVAIGTTAPLTNKAARASAIAFYEWLARGSSIDKAFHLSQAILETITDNDVSSKIFYAEGFLGAGSALVNQPRILAYFGDPEDRDPKKKKRNLASLKADRDGDFGITYGVVGCPPCTMQVIVFVDDEEFILDDDDSLEEQLCWLERTTPVKGEVWMSTSGSASGDHRVHAAIVTPDKGCIGVSTTACEALQSYYLEGWCGKLDEQEATSVSSAIAELIKYDGSHRSIKGDL